MAEPNSSRWANPSEKRLRVSYFDDVSGGHHNVYVGGVIEATSRLDARVFALTPKDPHLNGVLWQRTSRSDAPGLRPSRRRMRIGVEQSLAIGIDVFVDLNLDRNIWLLPRSLNRVDRRFHVLHHAHQYLARQNPYELARTRFLRAYLRFLTQRGDVIIVHTPRAVDILSEATHPQALLHVPYPIRIPLSVPRASPGNDLGRPILLFVGQARKEKGLPDILEAMEGIQSDALLRVVGPQQQQVRTGIARRFPSVSIDWVDSYVSEPELRSHLHAASLIVTPYRRSFRARCRRLWCSLGSNGQWETIAHNGCNIGPIAQGIHGSGSHQGRGSKEPCGRSRPLPGDAGQHLKRGWRSWPPLHLRKPLVRVVRFEDLGHDPLDTG